MSVAGGAPAEFGGPPNAGIALKLRGMSPMLLTEQNIGLDTAAQSAELTDSG